MARPRAFDEETALIQAMDLFWEHGYVATTLMELTDRMGINRQSLYNTYGDKHGLFLKALDRYCTIVGDQILAPLAAKAPGLDAVHATIAAMISFFVDTPKRHACLMANAALEVASHDPVVADRVTAYHRRIADAFAQALARARRRGEIARGVDPAALGTYLVSVFNGMAIAAKTGATRQSLQALADVALTALQPVPPSPESTKP